MKKGFSVPINVIGLIVLLLVVFVVIITAFSGSYSTYWNKFMRIFSVSTSTASLQAAQIKCQQYCASLDGQLVDKCHASAFNFCKKTWDTKEYGGLEEDNCYQQAGDALFVFCEIRLRGRSDKTGIGSDECTCIP